MALRMQQSFDRKLGARLRDARLAKGWTLQAMGKKLGVRYNTVFKTENGLVRITVERLVLAARALNLPVTDFLNGL